MLTHADLLANIRAIGEALGVRSDDVGVSWLPLYHDMGLIGSWLMPLYFGLPLVVLSPLAFLSRPVRWLRAFDRYHATLGAAPNFAYELAAAKISEADIDGLDLSTWRAALNGAEPVLPATLDRFAERFARCGFRREALLPVYGLAEPSVALTIPAPGRGPRVDPVEGTAFDGDRAYQAEGEMYITGRVKDIVILGARNLYPHEIEDVVAQVAGVRKGCVAAFGAVDPAKGTERLVVVAETRERSPAARPRITEG